MAGWVRTEAGDLGEALDRRLAKLAEEDVPARIWARDHTVWRDDPAEIEDRLGWLDAPERARDVVPEVRAFAREAASEGLTHAVLLGMGGSSLAPEVLRRTFGMAPGMLDLTVLDSTHPEAVAAVERSVPPDRTLFVVSSKSGTTVETRSHLAYFHHRVGDGSRFVAVTDPGSPLEQEASRLGFRGVFRAPPDVGGRYSALTEFGLLPGALVGADLDAIVERAAEAAEACGPAVAPGENPAAVLGALMAEAALAGRNKLTLGAIAPSPPLEPPVDLSPFGSWIEQLVAESTGKEGVGIVPVDGERFGDPAVYREDRLFATLGAPPPLRPWVSLEGGTPDALGRAFFVWELATAIAGHVLGIHPFDQPDVQAAKDRTAEALSSGHVPGGGPVDPGDLLGAVVAGDYVAIQAFAPPDAATWEGLQEVRHRIRDRLEVATTVGWGPRYLHSTGQLHKGGPNTGVFLQVVEEPAEDLPVPGHGFTFGRLMAAQAAGDLAALRDRGRRAGRVALDALLAWEG